MVTEDNIRRRISTTKESLAAATDVTYKLELEQEIYRLEEMYNNLDNIETAVSESIAIWLDYGEGNRDAELDTGYDLAKTILPNLVAMGWVILPSMPSWETDENE